MRSSSDKRDTALGQFPGVLSARLNQSLPSFTSLAGISVLILLFAAWLLTHRYPGIERDALLYNALAISKIKPDALSDDMIFPAGHVTTTLFPAIYTMIVSIFGSPLASILSVLVGVTLWFAALARLSLAIAGYRWLAIAGIFCVTFLWPFYGFWHSIKYGEPILTPRSFAEAGMMMAIAASLHKRFVLTASWAGLSLLIHPLMAGPAVLVVTTLHFGFRLGFFYISAAGVAVIATAGLVGISPFDRLYASFDSEWLDILHLTSFQLFMKNWVGWSLLSYVFPLCILLIGAADPASVIGRLSRAVLAVAVAFTLTGLIIGEMFNNALTMNLVLWRSTWLVAVFGNLLAIFVIAARPLNSTISTLLICAVCLNIIETSLGMFPVGASAFALLAVVVYYIGGLIPVTLHSPLRWMLGLGLAMWLLMAVTLISISMSDRHHGNIFVTLVMPTMIPLCFGGLLVALYRVRKNGAATDLAALIACVSLGFASYQWDARAPWQKFVESAPQLPADFKQALADKSVYWEGGPLVPWIALQKPSYFSCIQSAPMMLSREVAVEFRRRGLILRNLNTIDFRDEEHGYCLRKADSDADGPETREDIVDVCRRLTDLDVLVLYNSVEGFQKIRWDLPEEAWRKLPDTASEDDKRKALKWRSLFLYKCPR